MTTTHLLPSTTPKASPTDAAKEAGTQTPARPGLLKRRGKVLTEAMRAEGY